SNPWMKTTLVQAAWAGARKKDSYCRAQFLRIKSRRGPKKAVLAVAASMLTAAYYMLKHGVDYRDLGADHFDRRDKAKLAKRLIARLHDLGLTVEVRAACLTGHFFLAGPARPEDSAGGLRRGATRLRSSWRSSFHGLPRGWRERRGDRGDRVQEPRQIVDAQHVRPVGQRPPVRERPVGILVHLHEERVDPDGDRRPGERGDVLPLACGAIPGAAGQLNGLRRG